jgi:hypothetical protein
MLWLLTRDDGSADGGRVRYLEQPQRFREFDPTLYAALSRLRTEDIRRSVALVGAWRLFPSGIVSFDEIIGDSLGSRESYFLRASRAVASCPLLFFDPDNGIEVESVRRGRANSSKYVYWDELQRAFDEGHSLVIYQHRQRRALKAHVAWLRGEILKRFRAAEVRFVRAPSVLFVLISNPEHARNFSEGVRLAASRWREQLTPVEEAQGTVAREP